jgi:hypothetical protein
MKILPAFSDAANAPQSTRCDAIGAIGGRPNARIRQDCLIFSLTLLATSAVAQQELPARVGRISIVEGAVAFYGPGDNDWSAVHCTHG